MSKYHESQLMSMQAHVYLLIAIENLLVNWLILNDISKGKLWPEKGSIATCLCFDFRDKNMFQIGSGKVGRKTGVNGAEMVPSDGQMTSGWLGCPNLDYSCCLEWICSQTWFEISSSLKPGCWNMSPFKMVTLYYLAIWKANPTWCIIFCIRGHFASLILIPL